MIQKVCKCESECDCLTIKAGDEMNDVKQANFISKFNLLDDREFDKAMKAIRDRKKQEQQQC